MIARTVPALSLSPNRSQNTQARQTAQPPNSPTPWEALRQAQRFQEAESACITLSSSSGIESLSRISSSIVLEDNNPQ